MARPIPQGRDRLALLGKAVGATPALSATNANHAVGLNDFMVEALVRLEPTASPAGSLDLIMAATEDANDFYCTINRQVDKIRLVLGATSYYSSALTNYIGRWIHVVVFGDRSGLAYFYLDGAAAGTVDISGTVATDITSDTLTIFGRIAATHDNMDGMLARLFVISPANFPSAAERAAIAAERYVNPDAESPTLAARANYATERRVDIPFIDTLSTATVVVNNGTGAATFTVGGALTWVSVCKRAEIVPTSRASSDIFTLDATHTAQTAAENYGLAVQPLVMRFLHGDLRNGGHSGSLAGIVTAAGTAYIRIYATNPATIQIQAKDAGGAVQSYSLAREQLDKGDLWVTANGTAVTIYQCGQRIAALTVGAAIDLSGNCQVYQDGKLRIARMELWNPAAIPAGFVADMMATTMRPQSVSTTLGTPILDYFTDNTILAGATAIPNDGSGGGAGMVISGAGTYGASRTLLWGGK